jgi:hypothetical protein
MKNDFEAIDLSALATVTGGEDNPNTNRSNFNLGVTAPTPRGPVQLGLQGSRERTNYAECANTVKSMGGSPADLRAACGLPGGGQ